MTSVAINDAPDFEMPAETGSAGAGSSASRQSALVEATASSALLEDGERARQSSLFPAIVKSSERSPSSTPASDRSGVEAQKSSVPGAHFSIEKPHAEGLFVPRSMQQSGERSE